MIPTSEARLSEVDAYTTELWSTATRRQLIVRTSGLFQRDNQVLATALAGRRPLVVLTPSVDRLYGNLIRGYLQQHCAGGFHTLLLRRTEQSKTLDAVTEICEYASEMGLGRADPMVAVGGGVCTDLVGLAAALFRRGVPHLKVPTTLIGLVDAGLGTKNAVNHAGRKSILGTFHPPEASLLDPGLVASLPRRHIVNGMAEIAKVALVTDARLAEILESRGASLAYSGLAMRAADAELLVTHAVRGMLDQLGCNLFECTGYARAMDFGHTFSPHIEVASEHDVLHGEAVAMDMAMSLCISNTLGLIGDAECERGLDLLRSLGLELAWCGLDVHKLMDSLSSICEHRGGQLNLCLPTDIGSHTFASLADLDVTILRHAQDRLTAAQPSGTVAGPGR